MPKTSVFKIYILLVLVSCNGCSALNYSAKKSDKTNTASTASTESNPENQPKNITGNITGNKQNLENKKSIINSLSARRKDEHQGISNLRLQILRDTALSVGARGGLAYRAKQLNKLLSSYDSLLSRIFNFNGLLLDHNVLPPVLIEARNSLSLTSDDIIRVADVNYQILHQARFVTSCPHWRDYLWMNYSHPENPDKSLLPANKAEKMVWRKYIESGWEAGVQQADTICKENISKLQRDYNGMVRYKRLLDQQMVSPPYVASLDMGVTGDKTNLTINDKMLRITAFPSFQTDSEQWKTEIRQHE